MDFINYQCKFIYCGYNIAKYEDYQKIIFHSSIQRIPLKQLFLKNLRRLFLLKILQICFDISDKYYLSGSVIISNRISVKLDPVKSSKRLYIFTNQYTCVLYIYI